jgi:hypothetical protein
MKQYAVDVQVTYQYNKIKYHFAKLLQLGESSTTILEKMLMSQAEPPPKVEEVLKEEQIELVGHLKYVKEWNKLEHQSMFVKNGEEQSSIQLLFPLGADEVLNKDYLVRLQNMEAQKIKVDIRAVQIGFTNTNKPKMEVLSIISSTINSLKI